MRIVILGATGMLGHKLWQHLPTRFPDTFAMIRTPRTAWRVTGLFDHDHVVEGVDVSQLALLEDALGRIAPDVIVNCVAVTKRREEADDPIANITFNALLPHRLEQWVEKHGGRVIHFSTDCVFSGRDGGYSEQSAPDAADLYGRTKALGEVVGRRALTLRSSFIGRELRQYTELLEWFLAQRGRRIHGYRQALYTGVSTICMARLVGDIIERHPQLSGLYHLASEVINKYDLLCLARDAFGVDVAIEPDDGFVCKRNLVGERFSSIVGSVPPWRDMMAELAADPTPYEQMRR